MWDVTELIPDYCLSISFARNNRETGTKQLKVDHFFYESLRFFSANLCFMTLFSVQR